MKTDLKGWSLVITAFAGLVAAGAAFLTARAQSATQSKVSESVYNVTTEQLMAVRLDVAKLQGEISALRTLMRAGVMAGSSSRLHGSSAPTGEVAETPVRVSERPAPPGFRALVDAVQKKDAPVSRAEEVGP